MYNIISEMVSGMFKPTYCYVQASKSKPWFIMRPCQHDDDFIGGRSQIKVCTNERTQVHSAQSPLVVTQVKRFVNLSISPLTLTSFSNSNSQL